MYYKSQILILSDIFIQYNLQNEENRERKLETQNQFECAVI